MGGLCGGYNIEKSMFDTILNGVKYRGIFKKQGYCEDKVKIVQIPSQDKSRIYSFKNSALAFEGFLYEPSIGDNLGTDKAEELIQYVNDNEDLNELYGSYSFCIHNNYNIVLVRDYPGVLPLFYASWEDHFAFANDYNALVKAGINDVKCVDPGCKVTYEIKNHKITSNTYFKVKQVKLCSDSIGQLDNLLYDVTGKLFEKTCSNLKENMELAIYLSGGVDSSLIAYYISQYCNNVHAFTINGKDNKFAAQVVNSLNIKQSIIHISDEMWKNSVGILTKDKHNSSYYELTNSLFLPNYFLSSEIVKRGINLSFNGTGSDELFVSYNRHLMYMKDVSYATKIILDDCHNFVLEATDLATNFNNVQSIMPFFAKEVIYFALALPDKMKIRNSIEKWIIRKIAEKHLPKSIAWREPAPLQVTTDSFEKINGKSYYESFYW